MSQRSNHTATRHQSPPRSSGAAARERQARFARLIALRNALATRLAVLMSADNAGTEAAAAVGFALFCAVIAGACVALGGH